MGRLANLFVERAQDISTIDTKTVAENYADGKQVFYVCLACHSPHGNKHRFAFLIGQEMLEFGWPDSQAVNHSVPHGEAVGEIGRNGHQVFPVLIFVGDLVDGPEGVIPSGVWALGADEFPLACSEFLFQSVLPGHPFIWEWIGLPGIPVYAPEGKPYARRAAPIEINKRGGRFVEGDPQSLDDFNGIEGYIDIDVFLAACDYMRKIRITVDSDRVGAGLKVPVDGRFEIVKFSASTGDIFL